MTLRGARLAFMEEFPELGHLNVKRLKDLHGTGGSRRATSERTPCRGR